MEAKNAAIAKLNEEQMIHAQQAARGIEDIFATWTRILNSLSKMDAIIDNDAVGKRYMQFFYDDNQEQIRSVTRLDEKGVILYNVPDTGVAGFDISDQKHVRELLRDHKPVISDVFTAVEGFVAIALHVPIFRGAEFRGSIGILIDFKSIARRHLDVVKIGETGYAWVISRDGTLLYSPIPGATGKPVFETIEDSPSAAAMVDDMLKCREGSAIYTFDRIGDRVVGQIRKYAVYMPVHIGSTFWSIAVTSAEQDVLAGLVSFRNKLALVSGTLFVCGMVFSILGAKAWLIVKEDERRKQAEEAIREGAERFRQVAESVGDFIWEVDANGLYTYANQHVEHILGYTPEELVGKKHFYDLFAPAVRDERKAAAFRVFADRQTFRGFLNLNVSKQGKILHLETSGCPVLDRAGNLVGYRGADLDVTGRKQAELEVAQQRNELAHFSRVTMLGELAGSLAHELNQPLTAILSNAQAGQRFLADDSADLNEVRDILKDIATDDERAGEIIRRLRMLLKKGEVQHLPLNLNEVVQDVLKLVRNDLLNHNIMLQTELATELPVVDGDRVQLQQVLLNLIVNAIDAMAQSSPGDKQLLVRTQRSQDGGVRVTVADRGTGLSPEVLERIFAPYFTTKPAGMGLGLKVCRTIITAHGGQLDGENNPGKGAAFHCTLPAAKKEQS
jgi:PAS domain S-box-containing protein